MILGDSVGVLIVAFGYVRRITLEAGSASGEGIGGSEVIFDVFEVRNGVPLG